MKLTLIALLFSSTIFAKVSDSRNIPEVAQREFLYTDVNEHRYIQTFGVYTCVAVAITNKNGRASLAHFDGGTNVEQAIKLLLRDFKDTSDLSISLYGGQPPFKLEKEIVNNLRKYKLVPIKIERNQNKNESKSIMIDLRSGDSFEYIESVSSTDWRVSAEKVNRLKFGKRIYRHEESIGGGDIVNIDTYSDNEMVFFNFN